MKYSLTPMGKFWTTYLVLLVTLGWYGVSQAEVTSDSQSGAISGAASQAGSIGYIDNGTHTVDAVNMKDRSPGVWAPGLTSGTNVCAISLSGGASGGGVGITLGASYDSWECTIRESLRLLSAISSSSEETNQILLREVSCMSSVYWTAMERTYKLTGDERYLCSNPAPEKVGKIVMRNKDKETGEIVMQTKVLTRETAVNGFF